MKMDCQKVKEYLYSFIDGQLDSQTALLVREHFSICPVCDLEWKEEEKVDSLIKQTIPKEKAPFALKETIISRMEEFQKTKFFPFAIPMLKPALVVSLIVLLAVTIPVMFKKMVPFPVFSESISSHIKFLQGGLPIEITSDNPQNIKDWLQGKLDFAIIVPDLSRNGINLVGARLCHLKERKVAYLMYEKNGHNVSVFIIDARGINIPAAKKIILDREILFVKSERGYQSILCLKKGWDIGCIFVSDLPEDELMRVIT